MKSVKKIEKLVRNTRYKASAEAYDKALDNFMLAVDDHVKHKSVPVEPKMWRMIMTSRITKIAAAAAITIAGLVVIYQSGGSIDVATVSFAQITENMKQMPWLHAIVETKGDIETMYGGGYEMWFCFERRTMVTKLANGQIRCADYLKHSFQDYDPNNNTITITSNDAENTLFGPTALDFSESMLKFFDDADDKHIQRETGQYKGQEAKIFTLTGIWGGMAVRIELVVDAKKNVLLFTNQKGFDKTGQSAIEANGYFDYPEMGPSSIYDVGVPTAARIVHPEKEREKERTAFDKALEEAIAEIDSRQNWPEPRDLVVKYWQARNAKHFDEMAVFWPGSATWNRQALAKEEPVEYVFGDAQPWEIEAHIIVPYASKSYYDKHGRYSLKMVLSKRDSTKGRYYIVSGN